MWHSTTIKHKCKNLARSVLHFKLIVDFTLTTTNIMTLQRHIDTPIANPTIKEGTVVPGTSNRNGATVAKT